RGSARERKDPASCTGTLLGRRNLLRGVAQPDVRHPAAQGHPGRHDSPEGRRTELAVNLRFKLKKFLTGDKERVGFVLKTGQIVDVPNVCLEPEKGFLVRAEDLLKYEGKVAATWHTHPQGTAVLSVGDYD